jgi:hypothetical protein
MTNKETMIKELTVKITEVQEARDAVEAVMEAIDELASSCNEQITQIEADIVARKEGLKLITDLEGLRKAQTEINTLQDDVELVKQVKGNKAKSLLEEVENKAVEFFNTHRVAKSVFNTVDEYMLINTSLSELSDAKEQMSGYINCIDKNFAQVRSILLDTKIVSVEDQNRSYRGFHLGQHNRGTQFLDFEYHINSYKHQLISRGLPLKNNQ